MGQRLVLAGDLPFFVPHERRSRFRQAIEKQVLKRGGTDERQPKRITLDPCRSALIASTLPSSRSPLEFVPQRELHHPSRHHALKFTERQRRQQRQARVSEIHGVKRFQRFRPELQPLPLPCQLESLP